MALLTFALTVVLGVCGAHGLLTETVEVDGMLRTNWIMSDLVREPLVVGHAFESRSLDSFFIILTPCC